ncbi:MAG: flagellar basal body-associated FliL family protein [Pseudobdellovibrionaceae bacterium]|nr:flagellar basal body-associated FliL family protein [Pseudobdellovibrionaceae bacterium]
MQKEFPKAKADSSPDDGHDHEHGHDQMDQKIRRKQLILYMSALIFVIGAGSIAIFQYINRTPPKVVGTGIPAPKSQQHDPSPVKVPYGESLRLKPFRISLAGHRNSYVLLQIVIEHRNDPLLQREILKREPQLREIVLFTVQRKTREFLLSPDAQEVLRHEIRTAINRVMQRKIIEIHMTELLVM